MTTDRRTEEELVAASCDGDIAAFERLADKYRARMLQFAEVSAGGSIDAEAAVQDALLRAFNARKRFRPDAKFSTWLFTILRNEVYRGLRKNRYVPLEGEISDTAADPAGEALRSDQIQYIKKALDELPRIQRDAIILTKYAGISCAEAADVLKSTDGGVRTAVYKGLKTLRKILIIDE